MSDGNSQDHVVVGKNHGIFDRTEAVVDCVCGTGRWPISGGEGIKECPNCRRLYRVRAFVEEVPSKSVPI